MMIADHDLVTDEARFLKKKKNLVTRIFGKGAIIGPKTRFCHFLKFGSLLLLVIPCNDSLQQFLISSGGKTHKKYFGAKIWAKRARIRPKIKFFAKFLNLVH